MASFKIIIIGILGFEKVLFGFYQVYSETNFIDGKGWLPHFIKRLSKSIGIFVIQGLGYLAIEKDRI